MFATCFCARFQANPKESHRIAAKRILRCLKGTPNHGLWYPKKTGFELVAVSDVDHDKLVSWGSTKQHCVSTSTAEAQYVAAASCCSQVLWMRTQLNHIPIYCDSESFGGLGTENYEKGGKAKSTQRLLRVRDLHNLTVPSGKNDTWTFLHYITRDQVHLPVNVRLKLVSLFIYNIYRIIAIAISCNPVQHTCTKHIEIRYHFIKDNMERGTIELYFVNTEYQLAYLFTKPLDEKI
ncbi:hypothetical protein OSB04_012043 [Centaurea solstitialis]|uniref:Copia protein n=1 Tax=Centaurea solstitialis TaxID=347529 RepID=A0AA38TAM6_9ASTR|nr:hypothetical protein OSB04_012043 [Centaurea solstitialis]